MCSRGPALGRHGPTLGWHASHDGLPEGSYGLESSLEHRFSHLQPGRIGHRCSRRRCCGDLGRGDGCARRVQGGGGRLCGLGGVSRWEAVDGGVGALALTHRRDSFHFVGLRHPGPLPSGPHPSYLLPCRTHCSHAPPPVTLLLAGAARSLAARAVLTRRPGRRGRGLVVFVVCDLRGPGAKSLNLARTIKVVATLFFYSASLYELGQPLRKG